MKPKLRALLIDPFQRKVHWVNVQNDINDWHRLMDCQLLDVVRVENPPDVDIWVDDEGLLREPHYPFFKWAGYHEQLCGYGLVLSHQGPESTSTRLSPKEATLYIRWEPWEGRLSPEPYFEQLSRIYLDNQEGTFGQGAIEIHICSICKGPYQGYGHNAQPVNEGRCCDRCNQAVVLPFRIKLAGGKK